MLSTSRRQHTIWDVLFFWWERLTAHETETDARSRVNGLSLPGVPPNPVIGRRFPISPERAAYFYRAADEA